MLADFLKGFPESSARILGNSMLNMRVVPIDAVRSRKLRYAPQASSAVLIRFHRPFVGHLSVALVEVIGERRKAKRATRRSPSTKQ
jgi:hypothetical protein